eukprot:342298-Amphidinium_carterae.1
MPLAVQRLSTAVLGVQLGMPLAVQQLSTAVLGVQVEQVGLPASAAVCERGTLRHNKRLGIEQQATQAPNDHQGRHAKKPTSTQQKQVYALHQLDP